VLTLAVSHFASLQLVFAFFYARLIVGLSCASTAALCAPADLLKRHTEYGRGMEEGTPAVARFWSVLRALEPAEQALFLRFTFARTRLPTSHAGFTRKFKLQRMAVPRTANVDSTLPVAHTCVFQLNLPDYSSEAVLRRQLLTACTLCVGYDLDDAGNSAGAAPFDEDGDDSDA
jgi:hypothetical protein